MLLQTHHSTPRKIGVWRENYRRYNPRYAFAVLPTKQDTDADQRLTQGCTRWPTSARKKDTRYIRNQNSTAEITNEAGSASEPPPAH